MSREPHRPPEIATSRSGPTIQALSDNLHPRFKSALRLSSDGKIGGDASLDFGPPAPLFRTRLIVQGSESGQLPTAYDATADGQRFLINAPPESPEPTMTVVLSWWGALPR